MKKIGEGYYYKVFEIDTDTVIKKIKGKTRIFLYILFVNKLNILCANKDYKKVIISISKLKSDYIKTLTLIHDKSIIGNPIFINDTDYKQDRVKKLRKINKLSEQSFIKLINDYIDLLKKIWSFGISNTSFNFSKNCGYNKNGQFILIDFNETTFSKNDLFQIIQESTWLKNYSYSRLSREKQIIFKEIMNKEITKENVENYWPK